MDYIKLAQIEVSKIIYKSGVDVRDLPDSVAYDDWVEEDMTEKQIKDLAPDIAWDILDSAGMDRDLIQTICYPDELAGEFNPDDGKWEGR